MKTHPRQKNLCTWLQIKSWKRAMLSSSLLDSSANDIRNEISPASSRQCVRPAFFSRPSWSLSLSSVKFTETKMWPRDYSMHVLLRRLGLKKYQAMFLHQINIFKSDIIFKKDLYTFKIHFFKCTYVYPLYIINSMCHKLPSKYMLFCYAFGI